MRPAGRDDVAALPAPGVNDDKIEHVDAPQSLDTVLAVVLPGVFPFLHPAFPNAGSIGEVKPARDGASLTFSRIPFKRIRAVTHVLKYA
jgi:hypothetical protein